MEERWLLLAQTYRETEQLADAWLRIARDEARRIAVNIARLPERLKPDD